MPAYELIIKLTGERLFVTNDGTALERLNRIYNVSKHLEASTIVPGHSHAVWITNAGLCISTARLSWEELAALIRDVGRAAELISSPKPKPSGA